MNRYTSLIGIEVRTFKGTVLGILTNVESYRNNAIMWLTINDDYQVDAAGSEEIIDLINGANYLRLSRIS